MRRKAENLQRKKLISVWLKMKDMDEESVFCFLSFEISATIKNVFDGWSLWQCDTFEDSWW